MPDPAIAVTDAHPLIFHAAGGGRLGPRAASLFQRCEQREATLYVPAAVIWECSLLARAARINLQRSVRGFFDDLFSNPAYQPLDLTLEQLFLADELRFTRDPFDGLIIAAAQTAGLPLVTRDAEIRESERCGCCGETKIHEDETRRSAKAGLRGPSCFWRTSSVADPAVGRSRRHEDAGGCGRTLPGPRRWRDMTPRHPPPQAGRTARREQLRADSDSSQTAAG
jgi:PIN domain nuclease of toxin-antitoxin system